MSKETSYDPKIQNSPALTTKKTVKNLSPVNKNNRSKNKKIVKKQIENLKNTAHYNDPIETFKSESKIKNKLFSLEKIIDFMKQKNNELMREMQDQVIKTIAVEEHKSNLSLQNKNVEDLYTKLLEEKEKSDAEIADLRQETEIDKNRIKGLMQEINHAKHEVEHLRASKQRLMNTIRDQEVIILNEKKTKQQLESTIVGLNHSINAHCAKNNNKKFASKIVPMSDTLTKFDK